MCVPERARSRRHRHIDAILGDALGSCCRSELLTTGIEEDRDMVLERSQCLTGFGTFFGIEVFECCFHQTRWRGLAKQ